MDELLEAPAEPPEVLELDPDVGELPPELDVSVLTPVPPPVSPPAELPLEVSVAPPVDGKPLLEPAELPPVYPPVAALLDELPPGEPAVGGTAVDEQPR